MVTFMSKIKLKWLKSKVFHVLLLLLMMSASLGHSSEPPSLGIADINVNNSTTSNNSTAEPTLAPTSGVPSFQPSFRPTTDKPSTLSPTKLPTEQPLSVAPTCEPSLKPTRTPTVTSMPTIKSTRKPSPSPTIASIKMEGGFVLQNIDLTTYSGTATQQSVLEAIARSAIVNITSLPSDYIVDITLSTSSSSAAATSQSIPSTSSSSAAATSQSIPSINVAAVQSPEGETNERKPSPFLRRLLQDSSSNIGVTATQVTTLYIQFAAEGKTWVIGKSLGTNSGDISVLLSAIVSALENKQGAQLLQTLQYYASNTMFSTVLTSSSTVSVSAFIDVTATAAPSLQPTQAPAFDTSKPSTRMFITIIVVPIVVGLLCIYVISIWVVFYRTTKISRGIYPNQPVNKTPKFTTTLVTEGQRRKSTASAADNSIDGNASLSSIKRKSQSKYAISPIKTDGLNESPGRAFSPEPSTRASAIANKSPSPRKQPPGSAPESANNSPSKTGTPAPGSRAITNYTPGKYINMK